ncbi:MAG TPA: hypothetical protein VM146_10070 [Steroidobacteraceae bacterium]|nr:hypothetical protein [Steroidobacteraceae bacterium]
MIFWILASVIAVTLCVGLALVPVGEPAPVVPGNAPERAPELDLAGYCDTAPGSPFDLLFIHHSVGGQLLADVGDERGPDVPRCIYDSHPNGGGLRRKLEQCGYRVHEASYSSTIGQRTDLLDWPPKFREQFDRIRRTERQDQLLDATVNRIVVFKSCYPNNSFGPDGPPPPALTLANAKAAMRELRDELARHPDTLFVYMTAPPLRARAVRERLWKWAARRALGKPASASGQVFAADTARTFNNWMKSPAGWLAGYSARNVVVFDYFDILTGDGRCNFLEFASRGGTDDHPSSTGQRIAAERFVPFLNRAVRHAGFVASDTKLTLVSSR